MIGNRIKQIRQSSGLNQKQTAERLGISPAHLSYIESGKKQPSDMLVEQIAYKFLVNENWLKTGEGTKEFIEETMNEEDILSFWCSSPGYIVKYIRLAKMLFMCGNLDEIYNDIINNDCIGILLNFVISKALGDKDAKESSQRFFDEMATAFPEFRDFCISYFRERSGELQQYQKHQSTLWKEADELGRHVDSGVYPFIRGNIGHLEEKLLEHRVFS